MNRGFSLISTLVALAILGIVSMSFVSMMVTQNRLVHRIDQKLARASLRSSILRTMGDVNQCSCHFDPDINKLIPQGEDLLVNTNTYEDIDIGSIRMGCDFESLGNVIVSSGAEILGFSGLIANEVKVSDIRPTGSTDQYYGNLVVGYQYSIDSQDQSGANLSIPLIFNIDSSVGTPSARPIESCWGNSGTESALVGADCYQVSSTEEGSEVKKYQSMIGCGGSFHNQLENQTLLGFQAGSTTGLKSTSLGYRAGNRVESYANIILGFLAGNEKSLGSSNILVGYKTGALLKEEEWSTIIGYMAAGEAMPVNNSLGLQHSILVGSEAGVRYSSAPEVVLMGYQAGLEFSSDSIFGGIVLGSSSGQKANGRHNILVGFESGKNYMDGEKSVFIGASAGGEARIVKNSVFIGQSAGENSYKARYNLAIGFSSGRELKESDYNVLVGAYSGGSIQGGDQNIFMGHGTGQFNEGGEKNTFMGSQSGYINTDGRFNNFIGVESGYGNTTGDFNIMLGFQAGRQNTSGSRNIFIGGGAADLSNYRTANSKLVIGVEGHPEWLTGDIQSHGNLYVNGQQVALTSSQFLKKNIQPVEDFQEHLLELLKTPLFTYHYKNESDIPEKQRMGIISEELSDRLQIRKKGRLSHPDWPTIYGSFLAGIKALHELFDSFKTEISSQLQVLQGYFNKLKKKQVQMIKVMEQFKGDLLGVREELKESRNKIGQMKRELLSARRRIQSEWDELARVSYKVPTATIESLSTPSIVQSNFCDNGKICN